MFSIFLESASFLGFPSLFGKSVTVSLVLLAYCDFFGPNPAVGDEDDAVRRAQRRRAVFPAEECGPDHSGS